MEKTNSLGIFADKETITVVFDANAAGGHSAVSSFSIAFDDQDKTEVIAKASERIKDSKIAFSSCYAAINCGYYNQFKVKSRFNTLKQIAQTVKFDAEELMAVDITEKAVAYSVDGLQAESADLTLYGADKEHLKRILDDINGLGVDPITIEPDIVCLGRFFKHTIINRDTDFDGAMVVVVDNVRCYFIVYNENNTTVSGRSFIVSDITDKQSVISQQLKLSMAAMGTNNKISKIYLADITGTVAKEQLTEQSGCKIFSVDLKQELSKLGVKSEDENCIGYAAAFGAAIAGKIDRVDFRRDFSPYQGKRQILEKMLKILSISVSVLLITLVLFFQIKAWQKSADTNKLEKSIISDVSKVISKSRLNSRESIINILKRELIKIKDQKSGKLTLESGSIEAKLNFVLEVINTTPANTDLNIQTIDITSRTIRITGDTNSSNSTLQFFEAIKKHQQLTIDERFSKTSGNRNTFRVGMTVKD